MKRIIISLLAMFTVTATVQAQHLESMKNDGKAFTVAYAVSDDGYLNVRSKLIAHNATTVIYCDDYAEGGLKPFYTVTEGTVIADTFFE